MITPAALARVILHPKGGLKNIPAGARRIALLNQADTPELQAQAAAMRSELLPTFDAVIVSSLYLPSSAPETSAVHAVYEPVAGVILAAGESQRFGRPKQLLEWRGKALVWHVAQQALQAGLDPVIVVCGAQMTAIQQALRDLAVDCVHNPDWQQGQGTSVRTGAAATPRQSGAALFLLADQPQISAALIRTLVESHAQTQHPITGPLVAGQRGNPVLFDRRTFADLAALSGARGGRTLFSKYRVDWIPWHDPAPLMDVDTQADYARLLEMKS
jgi:molybdenum cofactor cytidylyltransferase